MKHQVDIGQTDYTVLVFIPDSASTVGSGKTGLVAANLTVSYVRVETDNDVILTDVSTGSPNLINDLAALTSPHTDWGWKEVSSTSAPGLYRLDIGDEVFATGAWSAVVYVMVTASSAAASPMEFTLHIAAGATGGVPVIGTGTNNFKSDASANVTFANTSIATASAVTTVNGLAANVITAASIASDAGAEIADAVLDRDMSTGTDSGSATVRTPRQALRAIRNKWSIIGTTMTVTKENDTTASWTAELSTDAAANPVVAVDPAS